MRLSLALALALAGGSLSAQQKAFHVVDYDLAIDLPDAGRTINGIATLTVRRLQPAADTLVLDLVGLTVRRAAHGDRPAAYRQDAAHVRVFVGGEVGDTLRVTLEYGGEVKDGLIISTDSAGRWMAFGDNFPNRGRQWIPSVDEPSDKATVTWTVRAPSDRRIVANGRLLEETSLPLPGVAAGAAGRPRTLTRWRESHPIPVYLMVIAAAPLARYELGPTACRLPPERDCVEQAVYVAPEQRGILPGDFARAGDIVDFFSRTIAPFPYEQLAHLQSSTRFGGMENATAIFYADALFRGGGVRGDLIAHETAHQWFGDAVTEREWAHVWLSEGFATYFSALWVRHAYGDSAFRSTMARSRAMLLRTGVVAERPVIDSELANVVPSLSANVYDKGGFVLHMLRAQVGDSAFFRGVRDYWVAHRDGSATTDDLQHAVEARAGAKLGWLFDQWLRRPGYASLTTSWAYDAATHRADVVVEQGERFGYYRFPLTIDVTDAVGAVHRVRVDVPAQRSARVTLPLTLSAAPRALAFDPAVELLAELRTRE